MKAISLTLPERLIEESTRHARSMHLSRAAYVRAAVERMNHEIRRQKSARRLAEVSRRVRDESLRVNAEFAAIERDPAE